MGSKIFSEKVYAVTVSGYLGSLEKPITKFVDFECPQLYMLGSYRVAELSNPIRLQVVTDCHFDS